jgi:hypothetical protein
MGFPVKKIEIREMLRRHGEEEDTQRLDFSTFKRLVAGEHLQPVDKQICFYSL